MPTSFVRVGYNLSLPNAVITDRTDRRLHRLRTEMRDVSRLAELELGIFRSGSPIDAYMWSVGLRYVADRTVVGRQGNNFKSPEPR